MDAYVKKSSSFFFFFFFWGEKKEFKFIVLNSINFFYKMLQVIF